MYCYGAYANNARLVMTRGMLHYLDDEELKAVYGHELGHIVHRDFIVMTIAATLLNILWNTYVIAKNIRGKNNSRPAMPVALLALVFWWVAQYMLLFCRALASTTPTSSPRKRPAIPTRSRWRS